MLIFLRHAHIIKYDFIEQRYNVYFINYFKKAYGYSYNLCYHLQRQKSIIVQTTNIFIYSTYI